MYDYTICDSPSESYFQKQCSALEKKMEGLKKEPLLEDVDGSLTQIYRHKKGQDKSLQRLLHGVSLC